MAPPVGDVGGAVTVEARAFAFGVHREEVQALAELLQIRDRSLHRLYMYECCVVDACMRERGQARPHGQQHVVHVVAEPGGERPERGQPVRELQSQVRRRQGSRLLDQEPLQPSALVHAVGGELDLAADIANDTDEVRDAVVRKVSTRHRQLDLNRAAILPNRIDEPRAFEALGLVRVPVPIEVTVQIRPRGLRDQDLDIPP